MGQHNLNMGIIKSLSLNNNFHAKIFFLKLKTLKPCLFNTYKIIVRAEMKIFHLPNVTFRMGHPNLGLGIIESLSLDSNSKSGVRRIPIGESGISS